MSDLISRLFPIRRQRTGAIKGGPIGLALDAMSFTDGQNRKISTVGTRLSNLIRARGVWVLFFPTGGDCACPWSGFVIYDTSLKDEGQVETPFKTGLVAHELFHVLQRARNDDHFWPSGFFRPSRFTRWITDSTNYMEVLAYIVGWTIEYDLIEYNLKTSDLSEGERAKYQSRKGKIENDLATLTRTDEHNANRRILEKFHKNWFYRQNYRKEYTTDDGRIPYGGWDTWLINLDISREAVDHIKQITSRGNPNDIDPDTTDKIADISNLYGGRRREITRGFISLAKAEMARRFNRSLGIVSIFVVMYMLIHTFIFPFISDQPSWVQFLFAFIVWIWWFGIGVNVATASATSKTMRDRSSRFTPPAFDLRGSIFVGLSTALLFLLVLIIKVSVTLDISVASATVLFDGLPIIKLPFLAFTVGFFYQLIDNFVGWINYSIKEGFLAPLYQVIKKLVKKESSKNLTT